MTQSAEKEPAGPLSVLERVRDRVEAERDSPRGLEGSGVALADVVLAVCVRVEVHLACGSGGEEGRGGGEEGGSKLHCLLRVAVWMVLWVFMFGC